VKKLRLEKPDLDEIEVQNEAAKERIRLNEEVQTRKMLDLRNDHQAAAAKIV
jgi:hypothetical protein